MKQMRKTNPSLKALIETLRAHGYEQQVGLWIALAKKLSKPTRRQCEVNVAKLNRYTAEGDIVVVPGKVLGAGDLDHALTVAAYKFSQAAREKINATGTAMSLEELMEQHPAGSNVRIFGG
ncbi:MAG: 50S ribosomal protein L18e [Candidatus Methanofastidiosa archaeon]|jgi:large subunit ribosomal protein L18e|nr:50S ribosomal protein L18e [Candidatus Methanofastidiosa archaeon]MDD4280644.1 50S ribosomal protein L18e [Candidatus Methanofastidiosa archaeon]